MWDLFYVFVIISAGAIFAIFQLRQWIKTKRWIYLLSTIIAILSELAVMAGLLQAIATLILALVIWIAADRGRN